MGFYPVAVAVAFGFLALLALVLILNIFGLPANWIILGLVVVWKLLHPAGADLGWIFWIIMVGIAVLGEVLEFWAQLAKAKSHGSSSSGTWAGMIGAFFGAIIMAPLFFGLGALIGALIGAWAGSFIMELLNGRSSDEALHAAFGAMMGKFLGTVCKLGAGAMMIAVTAHHIWPASDAKNQKDEALAKPACILVVEIAEEYAPYSINQHGEKIFIL